MTLDIEINPLEFIESDTLLENCIKLNLWKNS